MREAALAKEMNEAGAEEMAYLYMGKLQFRSALVKSSSQFNRLLHSLMPENALQGRIRTLLPCRPGNLRVVPNRAVQEVTR